MKVFWLGLGLSGQILFSARFFVQWLASERVGKSIVPALFWHLSIGGSLFLLVYAISKKDPVFILGQSTGMLIYARNIFLIHRERKCSYAVATDSP